LSDCSGRMGQRDGEQRRRQAKEMAHIDILWSRTDQKLKRTPPR
jgi:hypothetical protein